MPSTRLLNVKHTTRYSYDGPVERSIQSFHLRPIHDRLQRVLQHRLTVEPAVEVTEYEDVFGNVAGRFEVFGPYTELTVTAESLVEVRDKDPFAFKLPEGRPTLPLNWLPRESLMLSSYLTSVELPDTQIDELFDYAMNIVRENNGDLLESMFAINLKLYHEYEYVPGSTSLATTPYDVYASKRGVCQDFAGLFICLARLLNVPARYACGYLYTGNTGLERAGSDATHAWVQLYLPKIGWKGFDPTNGVLPQLDHVRLAHGRFWRDTAPLEGTLFGDAVKETMHTAVETSIETA